MRIIKGNCGIFTAHITYKDPDFFLRFISKRTILVRIWPTPYGQLILITMRKAIYQLIEHGFWNTRKVWQKHWHQISLLQKILKSIWLLHRRNSWSGTLVCNIFYSKTSIGFFANISWKFKEMQKWLKHFYTQMRCLLRNVVDTKSSPKQCCIREESGDQERMFLQNRGFTRITISWCYPEDYIGSEGSWMKNTFFALAVFYLTCKQLCVHMSLGHLKWIRNDKI